MSKSLLPETYVTHAELAEILKEVCLLDTEIEHVGLRILAACNTRGGNPLDFRGREPQDITPSTVDVAPDTRTYALSLQKRIEIRQRLGRLIEKLKTPIAVEPTKVEPKNRLDAALAAKA
jgi:hypothetical protein